MPPIQSRIPVLVVLSWQFCPDDLILPVLFCLSILLFLFCLFNSACLVPESYSARPVLRHSFCRSKGSAFSVQPVPFYLPVLPVPFCLSCSAMYIYPVQFCLSCCGCPFLPVLLRLPVLTALFFLSFSAFPVLQKKVHRTQSSPFCKITLAMCSVR